MKIPYQIPFTPESMFTLPITPAFPNWERSFVSGPGSPLFEVSHFCNENDPHQLLSRVRFKSLAEGPPGHVHGGATAGLLDEVMGVLVWSQNFYCVTESMQVHYGRAIPLNIDARIQTRIHAIHPKTVEVHSTLFDAQKIPYVTSQGIFHKLSLEQLDRFKRMA